MIYSFQIIKNGRDVSKIHDLDTDNREIAFERYEKTYFALEKYSKIFKRNAELSLFENDKRIMSIDFDWEIL